MKGLMSTVYLEDGKIVVDMEAPSLELPEEITIEFLDAVFACPIGDPGHIAELHEFLSESEKRRFDDACHCDETHAKLWAIAAVHWASVGAPAGTWKLTDFDILWKQDIHSWLIDHLYSDRFGFWYAECWNPSGGPNLILSDWEFEARYGDTFAKHLKNVEEFLPIRIARAREAMELPWVKYSLTLMKNDLIVTETVLGPANILPKEWMWPAGTTFVTADLV